MPSLFRAVAVCLSALALVAVLTPAAAALPLPIPLPAAGGDPLLGEGVLVEGPLVNNLTLPAPR